jgi:hypothetical protein
VVLQRRPVTPVDSLWLAQDRPNNLMVINAVMFLDGIALAQVLLPLTDESPDADTQALRDGPQGWSVAIWTSPARERPT